MVAYRKRLNLEIQALKEKNGGNPTPADLREIKALERKRKYEAARKMKGKKIRDREQDRAKAAAADVDDTTGSPSLNVKFDVSGDASENNEYNDVWEGFESPGPAATDPDNKPEQLRLTIPDPTHNPHECNGTRGHEGGNGECSCGVGKCTGAGMGGDAEIWEGGCWGGGAGPGVL